MICFELDMEKNLKKQIEKSLGDLKSEAPKVLSKAANKTATEVKKLLAEKAQEEYSVRTAKFKKAIDLEKAKAKASRPTAYLTAKGKPLEMINFRVTPKNYDPKRKRAPKGKVLNSSQLKELQIDNRKAFIVKFKNPGGDSKTHITLAQRTGKIRNGVPKEKRFTRECRVLFSPSIPSMLGSEEYVYGPLTVRIEKILKEQILLEMQKIINKAGAN